MAVKNRITSVTASATRTTCRPGRGTFFNAAKLLRATNGSSTANDVTLRIRRNCDAAYIITVHFATASRQE